MASPSTPPRSPLRRNGSISLLANDDRGDYKQLPNGDDLSKRPASDVSHTSGVWPILSYCLASIIMTVVNKFVVSGRDFNMTFLLLFIQSAVCVLLVVICKKLRIIQYGDFNIENAKKWFPISTCLVIVIYTGSKSLQFLSIPVYTIFKNLTIILIGYGEVLWFGGRVTGLMLMSFVLMVLSSVIAAWSDISSTVSSLTGAWNGVAPAAALSNELPKTLAGALNIGYFWMFSNCLASAAYVLAMRKRIKGMGFKDWDTMFYNNLLPIPLLAVFSFIMEDWGSANLAKNFPPDSKNVLISAMVFSGAAAVFISYTTAWCVRTTSSTTYSMVGALNKLPVAASGMVFFGDPVTTGSVSAVGTGFLAGLVYAVAKSNQVKAEKAQQAREGVIPMHKVNR